MTKNNPETARTTAEQQAAKPENSKPSDGKTANAVANGGRAPRRPRGPRQANQGKKQEPAQRGGQNAGPKTGAGRQQNAGQASDAARTQNTKAPEGAERPARRRGRRPGSKRGVPLHIIPLGGLNEIGKNITAYECNNDIMLVDCGLAFPDDDMLGVDLVIPDFTWLEKNRDHIKGIVLTHGHEDHSTS